MFEKATLSDLTPQFATSRNPSHLEFSDSSGITMKIGKAYQICYQYMLSVFYLTGESSTPEPPILGASERILCRHELFGKTLARIVTPDLCFDSGSSANHTS